VIAHQISLRVILYRTLDGNGTTQPEIAVCADQVACGTPAVHDDLIKAPGDSLR